jgi:hypothetical protein
VSGVGQPQRDAEGRRGCFRFSALRLSAFSAVYFSVLISFSAETNRAPKFGQFPAEEVGRYVAGELVSLDHVNRRGALRVDGDGSDETYHHTATLRFAMLPYGTVWRHGAPAEIRDLSIGTHLHGTFLHAGEGDTAKLPPPIGYDRYIPKENRALILEDDFTFHQRRGNAWRVEATNGTSTNKPTVFTLDRSTRVWKGRGYGELEDLALGALVQCAFTWAPDWQNGQMHVADVWLDDESRAVATERQRHIHIRHQKHRWLAGWVDHVEHQPGGKGNVTLTIFGGMDSSLYDDIRKAKGFAVAAAEPTLRTWWQDHDKKSGELVERKELPSPPPGSSGIQLRIKISELLEGYRPGYIVRVRPNGWPNVKMPPEERVRGMEDRDPSKSF